MVEPLDGDEGKITGTKVVFQPDPTIFKTTLHFDFDKLVRALTGFMKIQADNCVPFDFVVPHAVPWDEAIWGFELGKQVNLARAQAKMLKKEYPSRFRLLTNMEFM